MTNVFKGRPSFKVKIETLLDASFEKRLLSICHRKIKIHLKYETVCCQSMENLQESNSNERLNAKVKSNSNSNLNSNENGNKLYCFI
jgi:hypothetical protein